LLTFLSRWQTFPSASHGSSQCQIHIVTRLSRCCSEGCHLLDLIVARRFALTTTKFIDAVHALMSTLPRRLPSKSKQPSSRPCAVLALHVREENLRVPDKENARITQVLGMARRKTRTGCHSRYPRPPLFLRRRASCALPSSLLRHQVTVARCADSAQAYFPLPNARPRHLRAAT
jgi:hypothetical protein